MNTAEIMDATAISICDVKHRFISQAKTSIITTLTVDEMKLILEKFHPVNRPISRKDVEVYKKDVLNGDWKFDGTSVVFDWNGNLINGQHRLTAFVELNRELETNVVYGVDPKSILTIDRNKPRKYTHSMAILIALETGTPLNPELIKEFNLRRSVANELARYDGYRYNSEKHLAELADTVFKKELDFVASFPIVNRHATRPGILSAIAMYHRRDPVKASEFLQYVGGDGSNVPPGPAIKLRDFIAKGSDGGSYIKWDHNVTVKAIHHFHLGTEMKNVGNKKVAKEWEF